MNLFSKRLWSRLGISLALLFILLIGGFVLWAETPLGPMPEALRALTDDDTVRVTTHPYLVFEPLTVSPSLGVILYPGGRVDPRSYAPLARQIAAEGYLVVIPPMPLNLAVFNPNAAAGDGRLPAGLALGHRRALAGRLNGSQLHP